MKLVHLVGFIIKKKRTYVDFLASEFRLLSRPHKKTYPKTQRKADLVYSAVQRTTAGIHNILETG